MGKKMRIIPWLSRHRGGGNSSSHGGGGWLLSACRYPRTASFAAGRGGCDGDKQSGELEKAATLDDINRFLCENFSSLYDGSVEDEGSGELVDDCSSSGDGGSSARAPARADDDDDHGGRGGPCEIVLASSSSQRFLLSSPGKSRFIRIMDDASGTVTTTTGITGRPSADDYASSTTMTTMTASVSSASASSCSPDCQRDTSATDGAGGIPDDGVAVVTFSKYPQDDFLRSMEEMLDAHLSSSQQQGPCWPALIDWDFMQDLLLCYLHLNDPSVHGHILQAFADLVAELRTRKDVVLSEEAGKGAGGCVARFHDEETDLAEDVRHDDDGVAPVVHGAMFSYSRH